MKKRLSIKIGFLLSLFLALSSCRTDLTDYENQTNVSRKSYIAKQLNYDELKLQFPMVAEEVLRLDKSGKASGSNSKIYSDSTDGFTIDTEKSLYIEDENGNRTYTFEILEGKSSPDVLENLVLKDIGNNQFKAYVAGYDRYAVENLTNLGVEDYKTHVTLIQLGDKNGEEIFGKYMSNPCTLSYLADITEVYVPGTICSENLHNFSHYDECKADVKPTSGYYDLIFFWESENICIGGGAGGDPVATAPVGGTPTGGTGTISANPCSKVKNSLTKNVVNSNMANNVKGLLTDLKTTKLPSVNLQITGEVGHAIYQNSNNQLESQYQVQAGTDQEIEFDLGTLHTVVLKHSHTVNGLTTFSLADIYAIKKGIELGNFDENTVFFLVTDHGMQYALTINDINAFTQWANLYFYGWEFDNIKQAKEEDYKKSVDIKNTKEQNENGLAKYLASKDSGLQLFKASDDFSTWQKLTYNELTNNVAKTNCSN